MSSTFFYPFRCEYCGQQVLLAIRRSKTPIKFQGASVLVSDGAHEIYGLLDYTPPLWKPHGCRAILGTRIFDDPPIATWVNKAYSLMETKPGSEKTHDFLPVQAERVFPKGMLAAVVIGYGTPRGAEKTRFNIHLPDGRIILVESTEDEADPQFWLGRLVALKNIQPIRDDLFKVKAFHELKPKIDFSPETIVEVLQGGFIELNVSAETLETVEQTITAIQKFIRSTGIFVISVLLQPLENGRHCRKITLATAGKRFLDADWILPPDAKITMDVPKDEQLLIGLLNV